MALIDEKLKLLWNSFVVHQKEFNNYKYNSPKGQHAEHYKIRCIDMFKQEIRKAIEEEKDGYNCYECGSEGWDSALDTILTKLFGEEK